MLSIKSSFIETYLFIFGKTDACLRISKAKECCINWNHLYCFYEVAKNLSIKNAAADMGLASSTVSEQIKKLEESHDVDLLVRKGRDIFLSEEGERVYSYAKEMFEKGKRLQDTLSFNQEAGYTVKVSIENHIESQVVNEFIADYWACYKEFGLVESKRAKNLSQSLYFLEHGVVDLVLTTSKISKEKYNYEKVADLNYAFFVSEEIGDRLNGTKKNDYKDVIRSLPLATYGNNEEVGISLKNYLLENSMSPKEIFNGEHLSLLESLARSGELALFMPDTYNAGRGLYKLPLKRGVSYPLYAVWKRADANLLFIKKLLELISEEQVALRNFRGISC